MLQMIETASHGHPHPTTGSAGGSPLSRVAGVGQRRGFATPASMGFTILELLLVMVLVAAMIGMTVGILGVGRDGRTLRAAVRTVATQLRYARTRALVTGQSQLFQVDLDRHEWAAADHHGELAKSLQVTVDAVREEQAGARTLGIRFFPDGSSTGGRVSLRVRGVGARVDVRWLTGEVSEQRLPDGSP